MQTKELFTRKRHNDGVHINIRNEDGEVVGTMQIRGLDSDAYREAHDSYNRAMVRFAAAVRANPQATTIPKETAAEKEAAEIAERAALVISWSFDNPCTPAAAVELLTEAPYISDQVWYAASDRDRFLEKSSQTSADGPNTSWGSADQSQQGQAEPSKTP